MRRLLAAITISLCYAPLALFFSANSGAPFLWLFLAIGCGQIALANALEGFFPRRHRLIGVIALPLSFVSQTLLLPFGLNNLSLSIPVLIFSLIALAFARKFGERAMSFEQLVGGAAVYAVVYILAYLLDVDGILSSLGVLCVVYLIWAAVLQNLSAALETAGSSGAPALRAGNLALTVAFILLAAALCGFNTLRALVSEAIRLFLAALLWLFGESAVTTPIAGGASEDSLEDLLPMADEEKMPEWLAAIFEFLMYAVAIIVAVAAVIGILYFTARALRALYRKLRAWMRTEERDAEEYHDEQSSLMSWNQMRVNARESLQKAVRALTYRPPRWDSLDNRQKVRCAMEFWLYRGGKRAPDVTLTAREHMASAPRRANGDTTAFADAYDRARYSPETITDDDARNARQIMGG